MDVVTGAAPCTAAEFPNLTANSPSVLTDYNGVIIYIYRLIKFYTHFSASVLFHTSIWHPQNPTQHSVSFISCSSCPKQRKYPSVSIQHKQISIKTSCYVAKFGSQTFKQVSLNTKLPSAYHCSFTNSFPLSYHYDPLLRSSMEYKTDRQTDTRLEWTWKYRNLAVTSAVSCDCH